MHVGHAEAQQAFAGELAAFCAAVEAMDHEALLSASRCRSWSAADVVVHVHLGLQELLIGVHSPAAESLTTPDVDAATYWRHPVPTNDGTADDIDALRFVQRLALAYRRSAGLVAHFLATAGGAGRAAASLGEGLLAFQGHTMTTGDFLAMWTVELAVHHLDLAADREPAPPPTDAALALTRRTADALLGPPFPAVWTDTRVALLAAGRQEPTPAEAALLPYQGITLPVIT